MRSQVMRTLGLATAALLVASATQAQGKGHDHGKKDRDHDVMVRRGSIDRDDVYDRDHDGDDDRDHDRDRGIYRDERGLYRDSRRIPPGLAKKPGQMPPGQYKKMYRTYGTFGTYDGASVLGQIMRQRGYNVMRIVPSGDSHLVYYRYNNGAMRRAIVQPGTDHLMFSNVPASLLQLVMARLY